MDGNVIYVLFEMLDALMPQALPGCGNSNAKTSRSWTILSPVLKLLTFKSNLSEMFKYVCARTDLTPDEHGAEHDLQSVEEVVANDDDGGAARRPALARTDRLDGRGSCAQKAWLKHQEEQNVRKST